MDIVYLTHTDDVIKCWSKKPVYNNKEFNVVDGDEPLWSIDNDNTLYYYLTEIFFPDVFFEDTPFMIMPVSVDGLNKAIRNADSYSRIVMVVYTDRRLTEDELKNSKTYEYECNDKTVEEGDLLTCIDYEGTKMQVVMTFDEHDTIFKYPPIPKYRNDKLCLIKNSNVMSNKTNKTESTMVQGMLDKMKAQFIPEKEEGIKIAMDGQLCVRSGDEYVSINKDGELSSYPEEMCMDFPVFSIIKPTSAVKVGDIIKRKNSFIKVIEIDGEKLKCLTYTGSVSTKKEIKDYVLGKSVERVVMNMFDLNNGNQFNPMMFMFANEGSGFDFKSLMLMQMMQNTSEQASSEGMFGKMNPMMLMMLMGKKDGSSNDMMELMLMSSMMGGNNPFMPKQ